jgi:hypothetical protein
VGTVSLPNGKMSAFLIALVSLFSISVKVVKLLRGMSDEKEK